MKKLLLSILTIALVGSIAFGATRAYFSDTAESTGNTFSAGTMDFRIARPGGTDHRIFSVSNLKPGQVVEGYFVVVNDSTAGLDMKWKAWIPDFTNGYLDSVLDVQVTMNPTGYNPGLNTKYTIAGPDNAILHTWTPIQDLGTGNTILVWDHACDSDPFKVNWAAVYKIEVRMQESAGNWYQGTSFTGDLNFKAIQCEDSLYYSLY